MGEVKLSSSRVIKMGERMKQCQLFLAVIGCTVASAFAQHPRQSVPEKQTPQDEDTVRISVKLVQVDGTVTNSDGRQVTDLKKEDFELVVDGLPEKIAYFSYISPSPDSLP